MVRIEAHSSAGPERGKTILLLDDDPDQRTVFSYYLKNAGYTVIPASDVEEGLRLVAENRVSLIVSDICMPTMSGVDLISMLKSDRENSNIPIILMTAGLGYDEEALKAVGATCFCPKEHFSTILLEQVRDVLDR